MEAPLPASDSQNTTIPTPPTIAEMGAMWLALREEEQASSDRRDYERFRRRANAPILERAAEDDALYGEAA
jgi:hypothetical protein